MDLNDLTFAHFFDRIGDEFRIEFDDGDSVHLVLVSAEVKAAAGTEGRPDSAFSIVLRGPLDCELPQRTYELEHPELGTLQIFIVPVQRNEDGFLYEAIFTRLSG